MKPSSRLVGMVVAAWLILLGRYVAIATVLPAGPTRIAFGNVFLCLLPLFVNGALLANATTPHWRKNAFWMLLALGCSLWLTGQFLWTYVEIYQPGKVPHPYFADIVFFLHTVPMIAALTMQPHKLPDQRRVTYEYVDFALIACWWVYLYAFVVIPWHYMVVDTRQYAQAYIVISTFENFVFIAVAGILAMRTRDRKSTRLNSSH